MDIRQNFFSKQFEGIFSNAGDEVGHGAARVREMTVSSEQVAAPKRLFHFLASMDHAVVPVIPTPYVNEPSALV
jgi:hypothetical protein